MLFGRRAGKVVVSFAVPGIYFYGVATERHGLDGADSAGGGRAWPGNLPVCLGCVPHTTPVAIFVTDVNGCTGNDSLPEGFVGPIYRMPRPLPSAYMLCLVTTNVTLFPGAHLYLPLCTNPPPTSVGVHYYASVRAPAWLAVDLAGSSSKRIVPAAQTADSMVTTTAKISMASMQHHHGGTLPLYVAFVDANAGATFSLQLSMHATPAPPSNDSAEWQTLMAHTVATPSVPLPSKLLTSITWAGPELLYSGNISGTMSMLETYRSLGFNTVPYLLRFTDSYANGSFLLHPKNRTTGPWADGALHFGPQHTGFQSLSTLLWKGPANASILKSRFGVKPADMPVEVLKWERAVRYADAAGFRKPIDLGYDGALFQYDVQSFCDAMGSIQPETVFADDEIWGDVWENWWVDRAVLLSENAQSRRLPGETDENLAFRMILEMFNRWVECLSHVSSGTKVHFYDVRFPVETFLRSGITPQYATYTSIYDPATFPAVMRRQALLLQEDGASDAVGFVPWLTSCTWGQMSADQLRSATLHSFGSGATGFSWFHDICFDDPGKMLALSSAIALVVPHERLMMRGAPVGASDFSVSSTILDRTQSPSDSVVLTWSGRLDLDGFMWLALTLNGTANTVRFAVDAPLGRTEACVAASDGLCGQNGWQEATKVHLSSTPVNTTAPPVLATGRWDSHSLKLEGAQVAETIVVLVRVLSDKATLHRPLPQGVGLTNHGLGPAARSGSRPAASQWLHQNMFRNLSAIKTDDRQTATLIGMNYNFYRPCMGPATNPHASYNISFLHNWRQPGVRAMVRAQLAGMFARGVQSLRTTIFYFSTADERLRLLADVARGGEVITCQSPLNVLKYTYDHSCY
jgi:hypothetical protein